MPAGRPLEFTEDKFYEIIGQIADGKSLKSICERDDMPEKATFYKWLGREDLKHLDLIDKYARAKDDSADALADDLLDIADKTLVGKYEAASARVAADIKKWAASKLKPKKYGDKLDMTTNGKDLPAPILGGLAANALHSNNGSKETTESQ